MILSEFLSGIQPFFDALMVVRWFLFCLGEIAVQFIRIIFVPVAYIFNLIVEGFNPTIIAAKKAILIANMAPVTSAEPYSYGQSFLSSLPLFKDVVGYIGLLIGVSVIIIYLRWLQTK